MSDNIFRWLHLSDFHVGKDVYGQLCLFKYILENIKKAFQDGKPPSAVFITGDIANSGADSEYELFFEEFLYPLAAILKNTSCMGQIFIVPGNHDVTRSQARAVQTEGLLSHIPTFLDPTRDAQLERVTILPRFKAFIGNDLTCCSDNHWIGSAEGALVRKVLLGKKQIGFLGLNSAWLSCSDSDRHNLSPGKAILEQGLTELAGSDLIFILSHHSIGWFLDKEVNSIKAMLMKNSIIYLYGHLHKTGSETNTFSGNSFLEIQVGASFQAREDEKWINRIIWGEADIEKCIIKVKPLLWTRNHQEWSIDTSAFANKFRLEKQDYWELPFPKVQEELSRESSVDPNNPEDLQSMLPSGWSVLNKEALNLLKTPLSEEEAITFFDGRVPSWKEALSSEIPQRNITPSLVSQIKDWTSNPVTSVFLLKGSGGEGKSTILRQVIVELLNKDITKQILWNDSAESEVPSFDIIGDSSSPWIIASDDAEIIGERLFNIVKEASRRGVSGICLLLSCRDTDWISTKCDQFLWHNHARMIEKRLRGLSEDDAEIIVKAWSKYNRRGLGRLYGLTHEKAVETLLVEARNEAYSEEGAFLGAMLRTRFGEDIKSHVKSLLYSFGESGAPGGTLRDAFAHIAIPHAENVLTLSRGPLARTLGCNREELKEKILGPLGEEAAVVSSGCFVLTRHRAIAETAVDILSKEFHVDTDEIIIKLMKAALELSDVGFFVPELARWRFLSNHFFQNGKRELGVRLAQAAYEHDKDNPFFIVQLAKLLRQSSQPEMSVDIFLKASQKVRRDRTFYFEWGISEGVAGNRCNSICLGAIALADNTTQAWPSTEDATKTFAGMGTTFARLHDLYDEPAFVEACSATAQLGLTVKHDEKGEDYFQEAATLSREAGVENVSLEQAFTRFINGVLAAYKRQEIELPEWMPKIPELKYEHLGSLLHISSQRKEIKGQ